MPPDETDTNAPVVAVAVNQPQPEIPEEIDSVGAEAREEIARISGQLEAIDARITEGLEGNREWTNQTISALRQELTDLRANLQTVVTGMPEQIASLREELTRLSQSLQAAQEPVETVDPVAASVDGIQENAPAPNVSPAPASPSPSKKRRVI